MRTSKQMTAAAMKNSKCGIYVHIPFCKARCYYCAFSSCCDYTLQEKYFAKLYGEIAARSDNSVQISTVYLGGGTPSSVDTKYLDKLFAVLRRNFDLSNVQEISVECNPESANSELLNCLKNNGVTRISFGLQSVNDKTLSTIGRLHTYSDFLSAFSRARKAGFNNINADLILGLPETAADFYRSVETVAELPVTHVSVYALELHENSPLYALSKSQFDYSDDQLADMYDNACALLSKHGFERYEISNFAKSGQECKHNLVCWTENRYFAFGASASGFVGNIRYTNPYSVSEYIATPLTEMLSRGDIISLKGQANEYAMLALRLKCGVSLSEFKSRFGICFTDFFKNAQTLFKQGLLIADGDSVRVPSDKIYVVNSILCELLSFEE